jgi:hypothetical protein
MAERAGNHDSASTAVAGDAPLASLHDAHGDAQSRRPTAEAATQVRASDIEPYTGLGYLSKLFRLMAVILVLVLVGEVITGLVSHEASVAIPTLLPEVSRLIVLAGVLWGAGDLAILLVDVGHDVRAARILLSRQIAHQLTEEQQHPPVEELTDRERESR